MRPRCRKSGSVLGWRAPDHRLTAVGLGPRGSGPLLKGVGRQPPASSLASEVQPALEGVDPTFRPLVGISSQPFGGGAIGARPFSGPASEASSRARGR